MYKINITPSSIMLDRKKLIPKCFVGAVTKEFGIHSNAIHLEKRAYSMIALEFV